MTNPPGVWKSHIPGGFFYPAQGIRQSVRQKLQVRSLISLKSHSIILSERNLRKERSL